ncbi:MAG: pyridoxal phosphate-dependent aminotransferase [Oscillospiraceae bacterium]
MISEKMTQWGGGGGAIRVLAEYGARRAAEIGAENVFNLTIGNPSVEPPACVIESMERLQRTVPPEVLHAYAPAPGLASVRQSMADYLNRSFGWDYRAEDIYMTSGSSAALSILMRALLSAGDEALTLTPYFPEYRLYVESVGAVLTEAPSDPDTFQIDLKAVEAALTEKTAVMIVNSPNNPSGVVLSEESLRALAALLEEKARVYGHPIYIVSDEPYRDLVYGVEVPFLPRIYRNTVCCYSFSKALSMPGERIGFLSLPPELEDYERVRLAVFGSARTMGYLCIPPLYQLAAAECIGSTSDLSGYVENRNCLYDALQEMGYTCVRPDGAFYIFLRSPEPDAGAFCQRAMKKDLLMVPGDEFGCPGYVRIAYCVPKERIERSLPVFRALAEEYGLC